LIIADTGFWVALANSTDRHHALVLQAFETITEPLITTWIVMTETCHLLFKRRGIATQIGFIQSYRENAFIVFDLGEAHRARLTALMEKYADLPMDLADASLVILAEHLEDGRILSTDRRDFQTYRWKNQYPFTNLLFP